MVSDVMFTGVAPPEAPQPPDDSPRAAASRGRRNPMLRSVLTPSLLALATSLPYLLALCRLVASRSNAYPMYGDNGVEALDTLHASHLHQLLGPYDRFGWSHPGPALFYWLALPYRFFGPRGPGMFVGVVLLNVVVVAAIVLLVSRRWGVLPGVWSVACLTVLRLALGAAFFSNLWNPYVIILPMVLFVILAADAVAGSGSGSSLAWAIVVGTFEVQTDISTGPAVAVVLVVAVVSSVLRRRRPNGGRVATVPAIAGIVVAAVMWLPPLIDGLRGRASNLYQIATFFTTPHATHTLADAVRASLASVTSVPFGIHVSPTETMARSHGQLILGAAALALVGGGALLLARVRHQPFAFWLAVMSLTCLGAGVVGGTRIVGPIYFYLPLWQAFSLITLLLALGAAVFAPLAPAERVPPPSAGEPRLRDVVVSLVVGSTALILVVVAVRHTTPSSGPELIARSGSGLAVYRDATLVEAGLRPGDRNVRLTIGSHDAWPIVAGVAADLAAQGRTVTVAGTTQDWTFLFGRELRPTGRESVNVEFYAAPSGPPAGAHGTQLVSIDGITILIDRG